MRNASLFLSACAAATILLSGGCKKYSEGPAISLRSKTARLAHTWTLEKCLRNGEDITAYLLITNYTEDYTKDGAYIRSYTGKNGQPFTETGSWKFDTNKAQLKIDGVSSLELTSQNSTVSSSDFNILRLKYNELWYYYDNGGNRFEFQMVKK